MEAADARNDMLQRRETKILSHDDGNIFPEEKKNVTHVVDWTYSCAGWECVSERYQRVEWFSSRCRNYVASPQRDELVEMFDDSRLRGAIQVPHCHTQSSSMNGRWGCWWLVKKYYFTILVLHVGVGDISMKNYRKPINQYFWNYRQLIDIEKWKFRNYRKIIDIGNASNFSR